MSNDPKKAMRRSDALANPAGQPAARTVQPGPAQAAKAVFRPEFEPQTLEPEVIATNEIIAALERLRLLVDAAKSSAGLVKQLDVAHRLLNRIRLCAYSRLDADFEMSKLDQQDAEDALTWAQQAPDRPGWNYRRF